MNLYHQLLSTEQLNNIVWFFSSIIFLSAIVQKLFFSSLFLSSITEHFAVYIAHILGVHFLLFFLIGGAILWELIQAVKWIRSQKQKG